MVLRDMPVRMTNVKKTSQFKTVSNGDTTYITQLKWQKSQSPYFYRITLP